MRVVATSRTPNKYTRPCPPDCTYTEPGDLCAPGEAWGARGQRNQPRDARGASPRLTCAYLSSHHSSMSCPFLRLADALQSALSCGSSTRRTRPRWTRSSRGCAQSTDASTCSSSTRVGGACFGRVIVWGCGLGFCVAAGGGGRRVLRHGGERVAASALRSNRACTLVVACRARRGGAHVSGHQAGPAGRHEVFQLQHDPGEQGPRAQPDQSPRGSRDAAAGVRTCRRLPACRAGWLFPGPPCPAKRCRPCSS